MPVKTAAAFLAFLIAAATAANANPGDIVSSASFAAPAHMRAWKIVYQTTDRAGGPRLVSGVVIAPDGAAPAGGRDVVSWAHPTTGIAESCAPSAGSNFFDSIPGLAQLIARGYVVTATDYPGLGTPGMHPYLIGDSEGRAIVDAVRAARNIPAAGASSRFVAWGHSQGAQGTLYAGAIAAAYAPELSLAGVVAVAPPTKLALNLHDVIATGLGRLFASYVLLSWSNLFSAPIDGVANAADVPVARSIAGDCIENAFGTGQALFSALSLTPQMLLPNFWSAQPWAGLAAENSADPTRVVVPLLVVQGTDDHIVVPATTQAFVTAACAAGAHVDFVWLQDGSHLRAGIDSAALAAVWMSQRFASPGAAGACTTRTVPLFDILRSF